MKRDFTDQLGRVITLPHPPRRIISLVPSQTELLHHLGLQEEVIGITRFCIYPEVWFRNKTRIGGTKQVRLDRIAALQPDLIIGNKEENERSQIEALMADFPVWMSDIFNLSDSLTMIEAVGALVDRTEKAKQLTEQIAGRFQSFEEKVQRKNITRVAYLIWDQPMMVAGSPTFIDDLLQRCGWENAFLNREERYPEVTVEELQLAAPELILLSSEPYPFREKHLQKLQKLCPKATILLVDGELFSWYGSRLLHTPAYLSELIDG